VRFVCALGLNKAGKDFPSLCCSFLNSCFLHRCLLRIWSVFKSPLSVLWLPR
jgi:hypothetical protein